MVSPLPLQRGAALVAQAESISHVVLEPWSTSENYLANFMGKNFHKVTAISSAVASDYADTIVYRKGKPVSDGT